MTLAIVDVSGDPVLSFVTTGPAGLPLHTLTFSGGCRVEKQPHKLFAGGGDLDLLGFYVPGAGPLRPSHLLTAWAEVTLASAHIVVGKYAPSRPYGVAGAKVDLVDDGLGSGSQWPYVWVSLLGGQPMLLRYRLTVTQPLPSV